MFRKKDPGNSPKVEQSVTKAVSYEITVADMARRSERRAWWVATGSLLMSLALAGGYYYMLPLKEKVPFLVMADAYTGTATVARLSGTFQGETITTNEAINRSNVAQYVLARESYDSAVMGLRDWELVFVMSTDPVAQSMRVRYAGNNPQNPFVMYGRERAIRVKILSITPLGAEPNGSFRGASVRIQRSLLDKGLAQAPRVLALEREAASLDGASHWRRLWRIVAPISLPSLATVALVTIVGEWNDYIWPLIITSEASRMTLPVGLTALQNSEGNTGSGWGILMAGTVLVIAPVLIVFAMLQRHIVSGLTQGSVTG